MSTKTIAVDTRVYDRLAAVKKSDESFSKTIERLIERFATHTGHDILRGLTSMAPLSEKDSVVFLDVIAENRADEKWDRRDQR